MGTSESTLSGSQRPADEITTVSHRSEAVDPILERLRSLKIATPILTNPPQESSLTDILVRRPSSSSASATVDPKVLLELFSAYRGWQDKEAQKISKRQVCLSNPKSLDLSPVITAKAEEEIENKIEVAEALAIKLLQRFNYSVSAMRTTSQHLSEVHTLQVELGEFKGRLTEVLSNCDALCKRISSEGPEPLRSLIKPFAIAAARSNLDHASSSQRNMDECTSSTEPKLD